MSLLAPERVEGACALLRGLDMAALLSETAANPSTAVGKQPEAPKDTDIKPLNVTLRGLKAMHPPPKTSILYSAPEDPDGRLYRLCAKLKEVFSEFMVQDTRPLLLHATILNTVYVPGIREKSSGSGAGHGKNKAKMTIDAREILERYSEFAWMEDVKIEKVAICRMGAKRMKDEKGVETEDEEYIIESAVELP
jgi:activating signal cointegrator complex subunit 1